MGRPPSCACGTCPKCLFAKTMREWYRSLSPDQRKALVQARDPDIGRRSDAKRKGTPKRRASLLAASCRKRAAHPEQYKAQTAVNNAIRDGKLTRKPCEVCGQKGQAHHDDYSRPLEVRWLCGQHHREAHGR